jgi:hypothetical protein
MTTEDGHNQDPMPRAVAVLLAAVAIVVVLVLCWATRGVTT